MLNKLKELKDRAIEGLFKHKKIVGIVVLVLFALFCLSFNY